MALEGRFHHGSPNTGVNSKPCCSKYRNELPKLMSSYLKKALREVSITVKWQRGATEQSYSLTMYWVDTEATFDLTP